MSGIIEFAGNSKTSKLVAGKIVVANIAYTL
jgi:hypothetical protein